MSTPIVFNVSLELPLPLFTRFVISMEIFTSSISQPRPSTGKLGGYAYIIDMDPSESSPPVPVLSIGDTDTFGVFFERQ
jgi:hypothetical protein